MTRKQLPPPAGGDDLSAVLRRRHQPADTPPPPAPAAPAPTAPAVTESTNSGAARGGRRAGATPGAMDRRSWYMPATSAAALAQAVEDLHFATRRPKHEVLAALVATAVAHLDDARAQLDPRNSG